MSAVIDHNTIGLDYAQRSHFRHSGPIIDLHAHITMTQATDNPQGPAGGAGANGSIEQAALCLEVAREFGVTQTLTMCPPQDIAPLRAAFGDALAFNAMLMKKPDDPDSVADRQLDAFLEAGVQVVKLWSAPRGRDRGLTLDVAWRLACLKRALASGVRIVMVHVGDPDRWWSTVYADTVKYGTKPEQYLPLRMLMEQYPDVTWIAAHMGGDPEHPDHLEALIEAYPQIRFDTSATKWQVREVSPRAEAIRGLVSRHPERFYFGTDNVTRHGLPREHYVSRYWCQRTLWESAYVGVSPIADADYLPTPDAPQPPLIGVNLPDDVRQAVYHDNARRLLG